MTRIAPAWLAAPQTRAVLAALAPARPLFVGGCVRDALMGIEAADVDLCVTSPPETTLRLLEAAGLGAVPTGIAHGTVTAVAEGRGFEVTTLRRDVETDGRRARVAFTTAIEDDAARRDFTVNALYADAGGQVIDPLGGLPDLAAGRVRFVGDPAARIAEDYLRILRFFRFSARLSRTGLDPAGLAACAAGAGGIASLSRERVGHEMKRLLGTADPAEAVEAMAASGVLSAVAPWAGAAGLAPLVAIEARSGVPADWPRRLAAIAIGDAVTAWRLSRAEARRLTAIEAATEAAMAADLPPAGLGHLFGVPAATDALLLRASQGLAALPDDFAAEIARGAEAGFPLSAADLLAAGVPRGPDLGRLLITLRRKGAVEGCRADRAGLLARLADQTSGGSTS